MRLLAVATLSLVIASPLALAQTSAPAPAEPAGSAAPPSPAAIQLATKLYTDTHAEAVFQLIGSEQLQREQAGAVQLAGAKRDCPALQSSWSSFVQKVQPIYASMADAQFRQGAINIYAKSFSEAELRDITNFIESPSGRKWDAVQSQVNQQMMMLAADREKTHETQLRGAVTEFETGFKSALATCPASAAAPASTPAPRKKGH